MLPNYDDFLIKRFEQPDEVRTFEKGKFEMAKIGIDDDRSRELRTGMEMVGARGSSDRRDFLRSGTYRHGCVRSRRLPDERRTLLRNAGDLFYIGPGHDSWVVGDEPYVSLHFLGAEHYAQRNR
jgi:hypothetical protein